MVSQKLERIDDLRRLLATYGKEHLFRGQTNHYELPSGTPSLTSSFVRDGCIPDIMLQWTFMAAAILRMFDDPIDDRRRLVDLTHALFQHYGWRSFYVDLTENPAIATWFASFSFQRRIVFAACSTPTDDPVYLFNYGASYIPHTGLGHVYVLSKQVLKQAGHRLVNLPEEIQSDDFKLRFRVQDAWLAGIYDGQPQHLSPEAIVAHLSAPAELFRQLAAEHGYSDISSVFPEPETDVLYRIIMDVPWLQTGDILGVPAYARCLQIPDYHVKHENSLPETLALVRPFWLSEGFKGPEAVVFTKTPDFLFYTHAFDNDPCNRVRLPYLLSLLNQHDIVIAEAELPLTRPRSRPDTTYWKGIYIKRVSDKLVDIGAVFADHPSDKLRSLSLMASFQYRRINDSELLREPNPADCDCHDPVFHYQHLRVLQEIESHIDAHKPRVESASLLDLRS